MALIPPQPVGQVPGSGLWNDWIEKIRTIVNGLSTSISWSIITGKPTTIAGFGITDGVSTGVTLDANRLILGNGSHAVVDMASLGTTTTVLHGNAAGAPSFSAVSLTADVSGTLPVGNGGTGQTALSALTANPSTSIGLTAVNGSASTFMRSDAAPALSQSISPVWTSDHNWTDGVELRVGTGADLVMYHDGTHSYIKNNTGLLRIFDGATELARYSAAAGVQFLTTTGIPTDNVEFRIGDADDLRLVHNGTDSVIENNTGNLILRVGGELNIDEVTTTTTAPAAGGAGALPATPTGYVTMLINGVSRQIAYY